MILKLKIICLYDIITHALSMVVPNRGTADAPI